MLEIHIQNYFIDEVFIAKSQAHATRIVKKINSLLLFAVQLSFGGEPKLQDFTGKNWERDYYIKMRAYKNLKPGGIKLDVRQTTVNGNNTRTF